MPASTPSATAASVQQADVCLVARLCAIDPQFAGGVVVRSFAGPVRDRWLHDFRAMLEPAGAWRSVPVHVDDERLLGGIDLAATLGSGRPVALRGLLAQADGGVLLLSMAERITMSTEAHIAAVIDTGSVRCARDGVETSSAASFGVVALDESSDDDAAMGEALRDRLAFEVDLRALSHRDCVSWPGLPAAAVIAGARQRLPAVAVADDIVAALCAAALELGVWSLRASVQAVRVARLLAALDGRVDVTADDAGVAARLVLAPRATRLPPRPTPQDGEQAEPEAGSGPAEPDSTAQADAHGDADAADRAGRQPQAPGGAAETGGDTEGDHDTDVGTDPASDSAVLDGTSMEDAVIAAAVASIPAGMLTRLVAGDAASRSRGASGRVGALQSNRRRGRPAGVRRERPQGGTRLDLMATLRAAVPWQRSRGRDAAAITAPIEERTAPIDEHTRSIDGLEAARRPPTIRVRAEDFHVRRFQQRGRTTTIFAVDASGSAALHRLAEAKGAVELLLADCYVRRDSVAVVGFRGRAAELLLPPTRSLVRAKRSLAELPGGGGTPLAAGIDAAAALADAVRRRGDSPVVVILSDGRANVARDGSPGRARAEAEARLASGALRAGGAAIIFVDTSSQPRPLARELAGLMGARYLFLPYAEAATLSAAVRSATPAAPTSR